MKQALTSLNIIFKQHQRKIIPSAVILLHILLLLIITIDPGKKQRRKKSKIFRMTEITEFIPQADDNIVEIAHQDKFAEKIIETDKEIKELDIDYLPQHKITEVPVFPINEINSRKVYPPLANKQGIEAVVIVELYIDQTGLIRDVKVLKDPGYGFGEAAVKALLGIKCQPAKAEGIPVAVKFRFPVAFRLR